VAAVTVAASVTVIVARTVATAAHFDGGAGGMDHFGSACRNGKGISRDKSTRYNGGGRKEELFHLVIDIQAKGAEANCHNIV
jgi:hypothetical protein